MVKNSVNKKNTNDNLGGKCHGVASTITGLANLIIQLYSSYLITEAN